MYNVCKEIETVFRCPLVLSGLLGGNPSFQIVFQRIDSHTSSKIIFLCKSPCSFSHISMQHHCSVLANATSAGGFPVSVLLHLMPGTAVSAFAVPCYPLLSNLLICYSEFIQQK